MPEYSQRESRSRQSCWIRAGESFREEETTPLLGLQGNAQLNILPDENAYVYTNH